MNYRNLSFLMILILIMGISSEIMAQQILLKKVFSKASSETEWVQLKECSVYANKIIIKRHIGPISTEIQKKVQISGDLSPIINKILEGKTRVSHEMIWDVPIASYYIPHEDGTQNKVIQESLYVPEGIIIQKRNSAKEVELLVNFLDEHC